MLEPFGSCVVWLFNKSEDMIVRMKQCLRCRKQGRVYILLGARLDGLAKLSDLAFFVRFVRNALTLLCAHRTIEEVRGS